MKPYRFLAEARAELEEQVAYFDEQVSGLGDKFVEDVEASVKIIREHPESGAPVARNLRKKVLRAFPFNLYYVVTSEEIIILAVAAQRRRPRYWRARLKPERR